MSCIDEMIYENPFEDLLQDNFFYNSTAGGHFCNLKDCIPPLHFCESSREKENCCRALQAPSTNVIYTKPRPLGSNPKEIAKHRSFQ